MLYTFHLHPQLSNLSKLRQKVEAIFKEENISDDITQKNILLALTELFVNVVKHGELAQGNVVKFRIEHNDSKLEIVLSDKGKSYDPHRLKPPDITELPENGFGVYLVKSVMDTFDYLPKSCSCPYNITKIIKYV